MGEAGETARETVPRPWRMRGAMSSLAARFEAFLAGAEFDRGPWLAVAFGCGIGLWFLLAGPWQWLAVIAGSLVVGSFRSFPEGMTIAICFVIFS